MSKAIVLSRVSTTRQEPVADVYTNVDNNIYEIHMNSWTGDAYMMTRGLLDMAK